MLAVTSGPSRTPQELEREAEYSMNSHGKLTEDRPKEASVSPR